MTAIRRRKLIFTCIRCVLLTLVALALDWAGYLVRLEHGLYDLRELYCQRHAPRPTPDLVHLDIDENTVEQIGRFPWPRELMAEILDEVALTKPKVLLMDILFSEPQQVSFDEHGKALDGDALLSESMRRLGHALIPCSLSFDLPPPPDSLQQQLVRILALDPELTTEQCIHQLQTQGPDAATKVEDIQQAFLSARPAALYERIHDEWARGLTDRDQLLRKILPHDDPSLNSVLRRLFNEEYDRVSRERELSRFTMGLPPGLPPVLRASREISPILRISQAAAFSGFVDYLPDHAEGTVRSVPLFAEFRGRLVPQMSLAAACAMLDVDVKKLELAPDTVTIPREGGHDIVIPVSSRAATDVGAVGFLMELPMFGKKNSYFTMYDYPRYRAVAQHVSVYEVYRIILQSRKLKRNETVAEGEIADVAAASEDVALVEALDLTDTMAGNKYVTSPLQGEARLQLIRSTLDGMSETAAGLASIPDLGPAERKLLGNLKSSDGQLRAILKKNIGTTAAAVPITATKRQLLRDTLDSLSRGKQSLAKKLEVAKEDRKTYLEQTVQTLTVHERNLRSILKQDDAHQRLIDGLRADLRGKLNGKALFMGGVATSLLDLRPTSLNFACPGIVIHGALFNAIMTGKMWRTLPRYITYLVTIGMGLLAGVLVSTLSPMKAFAAVASMATAYLIINGYVLFDYGNTIIGAAGPLMAVTLVWSGITLTDFIIEIAERNRITRRFRTYVDPTLVDWVLNHPEQTRFDGEVRVMTMAFSDLVAFTAMTEQMGERAIPILSRYMGKMVPVIRAHKGYVSKLMGDGIYFFFGAPAPSPDHAINAVSAVLGMHKALAHFNEELQAEGLPQLGMRLGVSTGRVVIGDAGPPDASDYTAMGDVVNLASRLETANKVFGTCTLMTDRTVALLNGDFLFRPVANLRVAGKTEGVPVFEPLCSTEAATPEQRRLVELTTRIVEAFQRGSFAKCIEAAGVMEQALGPSKLAALYCKLSQQYVAEPPEHFDGQVILTEK